MIKMEDIARLIKGGGIIYYADFQGYEIILLSSDAFDYAYDDKRLYEIKKDTREIWDFYEFSGLFEDKNEAMKEFWGN